MKSYEQENQTSIDMKSLYKQLVSAGKACNTGCGSLGFNGSSIENHISQVSTC